VPREGGRKVEEWMGAGQHFNINNRKRKE